MCMNLYIVDPSLSWIEQVQKISTSLKRKLEGEIEIRATAGDVYHDIYKSRPHHLSHASPHFVQSCELHEGELGKPGSIIVWRYKVGGKPLTAKNVIEEIDEEKKLVRQRVIEGDALEEYKRLVGTCHVTAKDSETSIVKWMLEYEKMHPGIPEPSALLDACLQAAKDADDHHHGIKKSKGEVVGKLVKTKHRRHVRCSLNITARTTQICSCFLRRKSVYSTAFSRALTKIYEYCRIGLEMILGVALNDQALHFK